MIRRAMLGCALAATLAAGCKSSDSGDDGAPAPGAIQASLAVEVRDTGSVTLAPHGAAVDVTLDLAGHGYGYLDASAPLVASGRFWTLAEAHTESYTATFRQPALAGGKCGDKPVSMGLSLVRRADPAATLAGALTVYCGDTALGTPARMIRLAEVRPTAD